MKTKIAGMVAFAALSLFLVAASAQPPGDDGDKGPKKGPPPDGKKGGPYEPGKIMPPHIREQLELTEEQEKQIQDLEKEVKARILRILNENQKRLLAEMRNRDPKGPPPPRPNDERQPPRKGPKGKDQGKGRDKGNLPERPE